MAGVTILHSFTITVSGGTGSVNTTATNGFQSMQYVGYIAWIFLKAPSTGDTFDVKITTPNSNDPFEKKNIVTQIRENINFLVRGINTITISNARRTPGVSADGTYTGEIGFKEEKA